MFKKDDNRNRPKNPSEIPPIKEPPSDPYRDDNPERKKDYL